MPLTATGTEGRFDVTAILHGGGISGRRARSATASPAR